MFRPEPLMSNTLFLMEYSVSFGADKLRNKQNRQCAATDANSQNPSLFCQDQEKQMESEDYHFTPTKSKMGDSDELVGIKWSKRKNG